MKTILFSLFILSVSFISCTTSTTTSTSTSTSTKSTTRTFNGGKLIYNETITDAEANALGAYLIDSAFYDGQPIVAQVARLNNVIHFSMILDDKEAYSDEYEAVATVMVEELEQKVFKGNTVEVDYCDGDFKVKKNIKGYSDKVAATDVTPVSMPDAGTADASLLPNKHWFCENITGGEPKDAAQAARELEILKNNFSFDFVEDGSFGSRFVNQADVENPIEVLGSYTVSSNTITFHDLTINGKPTDQQMQFGFSVTDDTFILTSKVAGQPDLVMTFGIDN